MKRESHSIGMLCPECESADIGVIDSRPWLKGAVKRRRICNVCDARWSTAEKIIDPEDLQKGYEEPHEALTIYIPSRIANALKSSRNASEDMRTVFNAIANGQSE